jgi:hypothetical protein
VNSADALADNLLRIENLRAATLAASAALAAAAAAAGANATAPLPPATLPAAAPAAGLAVDRPAPAWLQQQGAGATCIELVPSLAPQQLAPRLCRSGSSSGPAPPAPPAAPPAPQQLAPPQATPQPQGRRLRHGRRRRALLAQTSAGAAAAAAAAAAAGERDDEADLAYSNVFDLAAALRAGTATAEGLRALYLARLRRWGSGAWAEALAARAGCCIPSA